MSFIMYPHSEKKEEGKIKKKQTHNRLADVYNNKRLYNERFKQQLPNSVDMVDRVSLHFV